MVKRITPQRIPYKNGVNTSQKVFPWASQQKLTQFIKFHNKNTIRSLC